ncbi:type II toxin-antitoxin system VapC family toxin [Kocuria atrinae]|uniref:type II toxin-antitoxin system VapC family toxin n=1 Tax=Kocuria atrinae TaxID=592377 RepID=UPI0031D7E21D
MILVDTSIWIDHLHGSEPVMLTLLEQNLVGYHPFVVQELSLGSIRNRDSVLGMIENLEQFPMMSHFETMTLVRSGQLWERGLSAIDVHLLGSVSLVGGARLWTRDKRLRKACEDLGVGYLEQA